MKHFKLTIDVAYEDSGSDLSIIEILKDAANHLAEQGLLSDFEGEIIVDSWDSKVEEIY